MNRIVLVLLALLFVAAGCGGNGTTTTQTPPPVVDPDNLSQANNNRLDPTPNPADVGVAGEIKIEGFTVIDENQNHVNEGEEGYKLFARLIDPTDDILTVTIPDAMGKYQLVSTEPLVDAKVQVEVQVAEDVDGDGQGNDTVVQAVPVKLVAGKLAQVNMTISPGSVHLVDAALAPVDNPGQPVAVEFERRDANGFLDEFYVSLPEGLVYFDDNNDGFIEPGEDTFYEDEDANGWPDPGEEEFGNPPGQPFFLRGTVVNINEVDRTMVVRVADAAILDDAGDIAQPELVGTTIVVELVAFTPTESLGVAPGDDGTIAADGFSGQFGLNADLIGQDVFVEGYYDGSKVLAELVLLTPAEPDDVPPPPFN